MTARVGVRELRQNLSVYLRRVKAGETLEVTERNEPVARLVPAREPGSTIERLYREGRVLNLPVGNLADLPPLPPAKPLPPGSISASEALQEQKEERLP